MVVKRYSLSPEPSLLQLYGYDKPLSRQPVRLPFPGAMGVETPTGVVPNPMSMMYNQLLQFEEERALLYALYDEMELDPTIFAFLEQLTEDATQRDARRGVIVWCESHNKDVESMVNSMLAETGLSDELAQPIMRQLAKYGDEFEFILAEPKSGVQRLINYHPATISRVHDEYGRLRGFTPYQSEETYNYGMQVSKQKNIQLLSKPWDFLHFRKLGRSVRRIYGTSTLFGARRIWRQVQMMEDKVALMRLLRNPDRYKHKIDVTGLGAVDAEMKIEKYRRNVKRDYNFDPTNVDFASVYTLLAENEDFFIWFREADQTDVEVLPGTKGVDDMRDLEMFLDRMFGALRAPKGYFGYEGQANFERSPSQQDSRFARQAANLQRIFLAEVARLAMMDLKYRGVDPLIEENSFTLCMVPPSALEELYRLETFEARLRSMETLARIGSTLGVDESAWLEVVLTEFPIFTKSFTETVIDALHDLRNTGASPEEATENVMTHPKVAQAIQEGQQRNVEWRVESRNVGLQLPRDLMKMVESDLRQGDERVKFRAEFAERLDALEEERKRAEKEKEKSDKTDKTSEQTAE